MSRSRPGEPTLGRPASRPLLPLVLATVLIAGGGAATPAVAAPASAGLSPTTASAPARLPRAAIADARLDGRVLHVVRATRTHGADAGLARAASVGLEVVGPEGERRIRIVAELVDPGSGAETDAVRAVTAVGGVEIEVALPGLLQVLVPPRAIASLAATPEIRYLRAPDRAIPTSEGVATTNASGWHAGGRTGTGVKVAVIDGGFAGWTTAQSRGDLPASLRTVNYCSGGFTNSAHGTATAEIVHRMAPGAQLTLICVGTDAELRQAAAWVAANGISVVNHSAVWPNSGRGDGSGPSGSPDAVVADLAARGVLWVNSAGNSAQDHWGGMYARSSTSNAHVFSGSDIANRISIPQGGAASVFLRWDEWPYATSDYDLYLYRAGTNTLVASSTAAQNGSQRPTEALAYQNGGATASFDIRIVRYSGVDRRLDLFVFGPTGDLAYPVPAGSVVEPGNSTAAVTVGAVCWADTTIESFSSRGPTIDGRRKPDLTAPDGTSSSVYGNSSGCGTGGGFYGTSASAPHVAGAAALVRAANPGWSTARVRELLASSVRDLGLTGPDDTYGEGDLRLGAFVPTIASAGTTSFAAGVAGTFRIVSRAYPTATVAIDGQLPAGLSLVTGIDGTATISGVASAIEAGSRTLTVTATNDAGTTSASLQLAVTLAPAFVGPDATTFSVGRPGSAPVTTTGWPAATVTTTSGALPAGVSFVAGTDGTATLAGTPLPGGGGLWPLALRAANTVGTTTGSLVLTVTEPPTFTSATSGTFYTDGTNVLRVATRGYPPATVALDPEASLPEWLSLAALSDGTALLAGTPPPDAVGEVVVPLVATSSSGSSSQTVRLVVAPGPRPPTEQTIAFGLPTSGYVEASIALTGTASSGLALTYTSLSPTVCAISGTTLRLVAAGTCSVRATQGGSAVYAPAAPVDRSLTVVRRTATLLQRFGVGTGTISLLAPTVRRGTWVADRVTAPRGLAGKRIELWWRPVGSTWRRLTTLTIGSTGTATYRFQAWRSADYRWRFLGSTAWKPAVTTVQRLTVR